MAYRYSDESAQVGVASGINVLAGLWLIVSPWVFGHPAVAGGGAASGGVWNSVIVGIVIALFAASRFGTGVRRAGLSWVNAVLGAWMIASPWVYGYTGNPGWTWNSVIVGIIVLVLAVTSASATDTMARGDYPERYYGPYPFYDFPPYGWGQYAPYYGGPAYDRRDWRGQGLADYRGRGPRGYRRTDERVKDEICDRMMEHPRLDASDIDIRVTEGVVLLEGQVPDRGSRRLAEEIADSVGGVQDVRNDLHVTTTGAARRAA